MVWVNTRFWLAGGRVKSVNVHLGKISGQIAWWQLVTMATEREYSILIGSIPDIWTPTK